MGTIRVLDSKGRFIALIPEDLRGGYSVVATRDGVDHLRSRWPCSRLPDMPIRFEFEANGDLVGVSVEYDGEDILALSQSAGDFGMDCILRRRREQIRMQECMRIIEGEESRLT